jgi:hypothetical protein
LQSVLIFLNLLTATGFLAECVMPRQMRREFVGARAELKRRVQGSVLELCSFGIHAFRST